jgi:Undecaprenyl-phosphate galactose phosphotransferase WbaP
MAPTESEIASYSQTLSVEALSPETTTASITVSWPLRTIACLAASDITAIVVSLFIASVLRGLFLSGWAAPVPGANVAAVVLLLCSLTAAGLYPGVNMNPVEELRRSMYSITLGFFALWSGTFLLRDLSPSRLVYVLAYVLTVGLVPVFRACTRGAFANCAWWGSSVAILGYGVTGKYVHETLLKNPGLGLKPVAILDDDAGKQPHLRITFGPLARCIEIAQSHRIPYGIVCMPELSRHELLILVERYGKCFGHLIVIPNLIGMTSLGISAREVGGIIGLEVTQQLLRPSSRVMKRFLDLSFTLAVSLPVAFVVVLFALLVKSADGGPMFYANERIGMGGKKFKAWKLRSMVTDGDEVLRQYLAANPDEAAHWSAKQKLKVDPRLTRIGRFIRKTSIDELPQFWNVIVGEMSVVGPRPVLANQVSMYGPSFELYKQVRPGITGLWQVSGRNHLTFSERVRLDKYVIQNWSVWLDLYILARTAGVLASADGAY